jgi:hypothetical protein
MGVGISLIMNNKYLDISGEDGFWRSIRLKKSGRATEEAMGFYSMAIEERIKLWKDFYCTVYDTNTFHIKITECDDRKYFLSIYTPDKLSHIFHLYNFRS